MFCARPAPPRPARPLFPSTDWRACTSNSCHLPTTPSDQPALNNCHQLGLLSIPERRSISARFRCPFRSTASATAPKKPAPFSSRQIGQIQFSQGCSSFSASLDFGRKNWKDSRQSREKNRVSECPLKKGLNHKGDQHSCRDKELKPPKNLPPKF